MSQNLPEIIKRLLKKRGVTNSQEFFSPKYENLLDPESLPDIRVAVKEIEFAIAGKQKVAIYGDYDIDGLCATTLLEEVLSAAGLEVVCHIPDRFGEGYGLNEDSIKMLAGQGVQLIITVDCGSRSESEIEVAKKLGVKVLVTDHHDIDEPPKSAVAVINPKRTDSKYGFNQLSGAGVAFKLVCALQKAGVIKLKAGQEKWLLDLVALSTVCDVVELSGENRNLVIHGLKVLNRTRREGLKALIRVSRVDDVDEVALGFRLGPRLNAAGRLTHARLALNLLMSKDSEEAKTIAGELDELNTQRRSEQEMIYREALTVAGAKDKQAVLVLASDKWSHGINGIVASKISEEFNKPTFVLQHLEGGITKGSARSVGDFDLSAAIESVRDLLISGGGHKFAAGVSFHTKDLSEFEESLNTFFLANYQSAAIDKFSEADLDLPGFKDCTANLAGQLRAMKPFGIGNPEPLFVFKEIQIVDSRYVGSESQHLKLKLQDSTGNFVDAIAFNTQMSGADLSSIKEVLAHIRLNEYGGLTSVQLVVQDLR